MKLNRILETSKLRNATVSRVITEIVNNGWTNTGWSGRSVTTSQDRRGLKTFAKAIRRQSFACVESLDRRRTGASATALPLP